jgi:hypothetical protein
MLQQARRAGSEETECLRNENGFRWVRGEFCATQLAKPLETPL